MLVVHIVKKFVVKHQKLNRLSLFRTIHLIDDQI